LLKAEQENNAYLEKLLDKLFHTPLFSDSQIHKFTDSQTHTACSLLPTAIVVRAFVKGRIGKEQLSGKAFG
jgi:hypothetical protein